jgi:hypothetical protein
MWVPRIIRALANIRSHVIRNRATGKHTSLAGRWMRMRGIGHSQRPGAATVVIWLKNSNQLYEPICAVRWPLYDTTSVHLRYIGGFDLRYVGPFLLKNSCINQQASAFICVTFTLLCISKVKFILDLILRQLAVFFSSN